MAIYFPNSNSLFLLVPKTGTVWLQNALKNNGVYHIVLGPKELRGHGYLALYGRGFNKIGAIVRHPVSWHASYWSYRNSKNSNWDDRWEIDRLCSDTIFESYVAKITKLLPQFTSNLYEKFVGPESHPIDFIGKQESLADDLCKFLNLCGEYFNEDKLQKTSTANKSKYLQNINQEMVKKICSSETETMLRYAYKKEDIIEQE